MERQDISESQINQWRALPIFQKVIELKSAENFVTLI